MNVPPPTPYPDVNALLHDVLIGAHQRLGPHFVGMYLEGSLVSDDFDQDSDIDFVVVTSDDLSPEQFTAVQQMHDHIATTPSWYADQLEGVYVSQRALRRYDPAHASHANLERGPGERLKREQLGSWWWVHLAILRERGVTLAGPSPHTLIDAIAPQVLQRTVADTVDEWALPKLHQPELLRTRGSQAYVVLTLCRMLYTVATGRIVTKRVAATWALATLEARWRLLIERAWVGRHNPAAETGASGGWRPLTGRTWDGLHTEAVAPEEVHATLEFMRYTIDRTHHVERAMDPPSLSSRTTDSFSKARPGGDDVT